MSIRSGESRRRNSSRTAQRSCRGDIRARRPPHKLGGLRQMRCKQERQSAVRGVHASACLILRSSLRHLWRTAQRPTKMVSAVGCSKPSRMANTTLGNETSKRPATVSTLAVTINSSFGCIPTRPLGATCCSLQSAACLYPASQRQVRFQRSV
jgi:hypothetical protein